MVTKQAQPPLDQRVARLGANQHGVVSLPQVEALGLTADGVRKRVARGALHRVHSGVYAIGHPLLSVERRCMAAVLACGPGAVLSHRSAADALGLLHNSRLEVDVIAPHRAGRTRRGIDSHRPGRLLPSDVTSARGIPCTSVARTLLDLCDCVPRQRVERAFDQAEVLQLLDTAAIADVLARSPGRRGTYDLAAIVTAYRDPALARSELEQRLLAVCERTNLPRPEVNAWITLEPGESVEVDFLWRRQRLVVEADVHRTHGTRRAFEADRRRDQRVIGSGWRVARFTWRQVTEDPDEVARALRSMLARTGGRGPEQAGRSAD